MKEFEQVVKEQIKTNPEFVKEIDKHVEKFYFHSRGGWVSKEALIIKVFNPTANDEWQTIDENLSMMLIAMITTGKAISRQEDDGVVRYKFTSNPDTHLEFLNKEKEALVARLSWVEEKIKEFEKEKKTRKINPRKSKGLK
jgi:hypothetical protein